MIEELGMRKHGIYVGTLNLSRPWYSRMARDENFPEPGAGEYWYDYKGFYFVGEQNNKGLVLPVESIIDVRLSVVHGTKISMRKILKIIWRKGIEKVSSGFTVDDPEEVQQALVTKGWA